MFDKWEDIYHYWSVWYIEGFEFYKKCYIDDYFVC